jgi:nucleotide-binding universal stress UspA family protein
MAEGFSAIVLQRGGTVFKKPRIRKILFATDLSSNAAHAFSYAVGMAVAHGARVTILYVIEKMAPNAELLLATLLGYSDTNKFEHQSEIELATRIEEHIQQFCVGAADEVPACLIMLKEVLVEPGKVAERILHHAGKGTYDVLVMGSCGHGMVKETLMGSTSRKVILHSPIPVLIVPHRGGLIQEPTADPDPVSMVK